MKHIILAAAMSKTLFVGEIPHDKRVEQLTSHFEPQIGGTAVLDKRDVALANSANDMRGFIVANPPKGVCFTITRDLETQDWKVCSREKIPFRVSDINKVGEIVWRVKTGPKDFVGTIVRWKTNYRKWRVIKRRFGKVADLETSYYLKQCHVEDHKKYNRAHLQFTNGEHWVIKFPKTHYMYEQQGYEPPNLFVQEQKSQLLGIHGGFNPFAVRNKKDRNTESPPVTWRISKYETFYMSSDNFVVKGGISPGRKEICRYRLWPSQRFEQEAWIECHEVYGYKAILGPIPCYHELLPKSLRETVRKYEDLYHFSDTNGL